MNFLTPSTLSAHYDTVHRQRQGTFECDVCSKKSTGFVSHTASVTATYYSPTRSSGPYYRFKFRFKNTGLKTATQFRSLGALSLCDVAGTAWTRIADCKPHTQTSKHLRRRVLTSGAGAGNTSSKVSYRTRYTQMFPVWIDALCRSERSASRE